MKAREAALLALLACEKRGAWSDAYLNGLFRREETDGREAALACRICAGVLQNREACDWYLRPYVKTKLQPSIRAVLRCAVYQLAFMDRIPASAAVNEAVELSKRYGNPAAARVTNAILRRMTASPLPPLPEGDDAGSMSLRYSHPQALVERFLARLGTEKTKAMLELNNRPAPVSLRVNLLRAAPQEAAAALEQEGVRVRPACMASFLEAENTGALTELRAFREGLVTVQDPAASLPAYAAAPQPGMHVLDCCAAPGGKSFLLAQLMDDRGEILSCDLHENKLPRIEEGARRLGIGCISTRAADAAAPAAELRGAFDIVLADVPCSGFGVIRKKPEIRYKTPEQTASLPPLQLSILEGAADCVKPGGVLVYSTCTLLPEENEGVIAGFLSRHSEFGREPVPLPEPFGRAEEGERTVWPFEYETDGFYLCRLRKST